MIFDLNQIPLNNPNSRTMSKQQYNNKSISNEYKKQIKVSIQNLMQEASGNMNNNQNNINNNMKNSNQGSMVLIKKCKFTSLHQDCTRHKKFYKFNLDYCSLKEIQFFESVNSKKK